MRASAWISWAAQPKGEGEVTPPIPADTQVEVMFRGETKRTCAASMLYWGEDVVGPKMTIVAYRIIWEGER